MQHGDVKEETRLTERSKIKEGTKPKQSSDLNDTSFSRCKIEAIDCPDRVCSFEHRLEPICNLFLPTPGTDCTIPCKMEHCKVEIRHFIDCPIWTCVEKPSTLVPFPTTTPNPTPTAKPDSDTIPYLYASLALNTLLLTFCGLFLASVCRRRLRTTPNNSTADIDLERGPPIIRNQNLMANQPASSATNQEGHFSIATPSETDNLLSRRNSNEERTFRQSLMRRLRNLTWSRTSWSVSGNGVENPHFDPQNQTHSNEPSAPALPEQSS